MGYQITSGDVETNYGWCGTCSDNENEEPEHCKQNDTINLKSNRMTDLEELENLAALANAPHDTFSFPSINKNWGYCSENCVNHNTDQEHSERVNEISGLLILPPDKCSTLTDKTVNYDEKYDLCVARKHKKKPPVI